MSWTTFGNSVGFSDAQPAWDATEDDWTHPMESTLFQLALRADIEACICVCVCSSGFFLFFIFDRAVTLIRIGPVER